MSEGTFSHVKAHLLTTKVFMPCTTISAYVSVRSDQGLCCSLIQSISIINLYMNKSSTDQRAKFSGENGFLLPAYSKSAICASHHSSNNVILI